MSVPDSALCDSEGILVVHEHQQVGVVVHRTRLILRPILQSLDLCLVARVEEYVLVEEPGLLLLVQSVHPVLTSDPLWHVCDPSSSRPGSRSAASGSWSGFDAANAARFLWWVSRYARTLLAAGFISLLIVSTKPQM